MFSLLHFRHARPARPERHQTHPDKNAVAAHARGHLGDLGPYRLYFRSVDTSHFSVSLLYSESILRLLTSVCFSLLYFIFISQYNVQNLYVSIVLESLSSSVLESLSCALQCDVAQFLWH